MSAVALIDHNSRAAWHGVELPGDPRTVLWSPDCECITKAHTSLSFANNTRPKILSGRQVVRAKLSSRHRFSIRPRVVICGASLVPWVSTVSTECWQQLDQVLGQNCYVLAGHWLMQSMNEAVQQALSQGMSVVPMQIGETGAIWVGPLLPAAGGLKQWQDFLVRLRQSRPVSGFLVDTVGDLPDLSPPDTADNLQATFMHALRVMARESARHLIRHGLLRISPNSRTHFYRLTRPQASANSQSGWLTISKRMVNPLLGPIHYCSAQPHPSLPNLWLARANAADARGWADLDALLSNIHQRGGGGCAESKETAIAKAMAEALERLAAVDHDNVKSVRAQAAELTGALTWSQLRPLAQWQSEAMGASLPAARQPVAQMPAENELIDWVEMPAFMDRDTRWLPRAALFFDIDGSSGPHAHSDGLAAGPTRGVAFERALLELVERDAVGIWWHGQIQRPPAPKEAWEDALVQQTSFHLRQKGRCLHLLDLTHDFAVPVVVAVSADLQGQNIIVGAAARWSMASAARSAVLELAQMEPINDQSSDRLAVADLQWREQASLQNCSWLTPDETQPQVMASTQSLLSLLRCLRQADLKAYWLPLNPSWMPVSVMRVVVPGLCSHRPYLGFKRLQSVPAQLGWHRNVPDQLHGSLQLYW